MTKIKNFGEIIAFCDKKKQVGDILTVSKMFGITPEAVRTRLGRKVEATYTALYRVIEQREYLIKEYQDKLGL